MAFTFISLCLVFALSLTDFTYGYTVHATGRILCFGYPLQYTRISLMDNDELIPNTYTPNTFMGSAITDSNGYFFVTGSANDPTKVFKYRRPDVYIRVDYHHDSPKARFEVDRLFVRGGKDKSHTLRNRRGHVNFGTLHFNTEMCHTYRQFYAATHDFFHRVGHRVPFFLKITADATFHAGVPYVLYDHIKVPRGTWIGFSTALHEVAHAVRHRYDGTFTDFLRNVHKYSYLQHHCCSKLTNPGFAFNEGWGDYWAGRTSCVCGGQHFVGNPAGSKSVEGNVAAALLKLQTDCKTSDFNMWLVLRHNPGTIHSFDAFAAKHRALFGCPAIV